ncbi:MAG TPA: class I SAM-dependent methyltransferase [Roseiflexaceae bacterium]|nr:class I SAM-dependent methyltransferase [Roseiflexaceae bacterium]
MAPIYEAYAPIYDAIGQGQFSARMAAWTLGWLAERGAQPTRVLDLACGTGEAALIFAAAGCDVAGVDLSSAMLEIARGKARDAGFAISFVQADMRELKIENEKLRIDRPRDRTFSQFSILNSQFDLVSSFYDSLNYLIDHSDLERVFAGAAAALATGGYLVFDLNAAAEYATWDERDRVTYDGRDCLVYNKLSYDPSEHMATGRIVWFVREIERWWRGEETHVERAWEDAEVLAALDCAGLALVGRYDVAGGAAAKDAARVIYVAQRLSEDADKD